MQILLKYFPPTSTAIKDLICTCDNQNNRNVFHWIALRINTSAGENTKVMNYMSNVTKKIDQDQIVFQNLLLAKDTVKY